MGKILLTADWHIRADNPICRLDNFLQTQEKILQEINNICIKNKVESMIIAGDIFHKARPEKSQELENLLFNSFINNPVMDEINYIAGNHDLIFHSMENFKKGSISVLSNFSNWNLTPVSYSCDTIFYFLNFGEEDYTKNNQDFNVLVLHKYCDMVLPDCINNGISADYLIESYPDIDLFVVGDNHKSFLYETKVKGKLKRVLNCGCISRQNVNEKDYKNKVFILDTDDLTIQEIELQSDKENAIFSEEHILLQKNKENRINDFVNKLKEEVNINLSFEDNLEWYCEKNKISEDIKKFIDISLIKGV